MGPPKLTVVVPATDRPETLARCCTAIEAAADGPDEVIVVEVPPPAGPATARNADALPATGVVLVFVDADVAVRPDAFARIRAAFEEDPGLAAVFGSYDDSQRPHPQGRAVGGPAASTAPRLDRPGPRLEAPPHRARGHYRDRGARSASASPPTCARGRTPGDPNAAAPAREARRVEVPAMALK